MKNILSIAVFLLVAVGFSNCSKDEGSDCTREDWVGSYTGTLKHPDSDPIDVVFEIQAGTLDGNIRFVESGRAELPETDFRISGCDIENSRYDINWLGGPVQTIWTGRIDGNQLVVDIDVNLLGVCEIRASK